MAVERTTGKKKAWTAMCVVPPLVVLIALGPSIALTIIVFLGTYLGLREFYDLTLPCLKWIERSVVIGLGMGLVIAVASGDVRVVLPSLVFLLLSITVLFMVTSQDLSFAISAIGLTLLGILYVGFLISHILLIRDMADGRLWVLFLIATVWAGDIGAFLCGSLVGKHKLYPKISPKKTVEGLAGALLGSLAIALTFRLLFLPHLGIGPCIFLGVTLAFLGQAGDFIESMLKRSAQVKDSGSLLPGHGGMLDRLDSLLFTTPFLYYFLLFLSKE